MQIELEAEKSATDQKSVLAVPAAYVGVACVKKNWSPISLNLSGCYLSLTMGVKQVSPLTLDTLGPGDDSQEPDRA